MPLPGSWFYKLQRKRGAAGAGGDAAAGLVSKPRGGRAPTPSSSSSQAAVLPAPPCSPNRASYYVPSRDRGPAKGNPKRQDTQFPRSPQANDIVFDVVTVKAAACDAADRFHGLKAIPELKLRPILTKPAAAAKKVHGVVGSGSDGTSATASPAARVRRRRLHVKPSGGRKGTPADSQPPARSPGRARRRRRRWLRESLVVVKESAEPEEDFLASMAEMIAANDDVRASPRGLEELLACYLALNAAEHHRAIVAAFTRAWLALGTKQQHRSLQS